MKFCRLFQLQKIHQFFSKKSACRSQRVLNARAGKNQEKKFYLQKNQIKNPNLLFEKDEETTKRQGRWIWADFFDRFLSLKLDKMHNKCKDLYLKEPLLKPLLEL